MESIFKYFVLDNPITLAYISWFVDNFPVEEFSGIDKVLYLFLQYCSSLGIIAKRKYLLIFSDTELRQLVREYNIKISSLTSSFNYDEIAAFEEAVRLISVTTVDTYDKYASTDIDEDYNSFKVLMHQFMSQNIKQRVSSIFNEQFALMTHGSDPLDVAENTQTQMSIIRKIYDLNKLNKLDFITNKTASSSISNTARLIAKTGIPAVDEDYGGMFSKALITFAGQPGSGKTRFLLSCFIYPALVKYKVSVRLDELELSDYEIKNILVSIHIAELYKLKIPDRDINRNELSDEQRRLVESARMDLFESKKYGKLYLSTDDLIVETMKEEVSTFLKLNRDVELWCVDYIGRIRSKPPDKYSRKTLPEIINDSLITAKDVAKLTDICVVCVNQFNDEGNKSAIAGKPISVGMIQGGQAVQRHSDYDLAITYTEEQKLASLRMLSSTKERASVGLQNVPIQTDLAISRFKQINQIESRS